MVEPWPDDFELREWQMSAYEIYVGKTGRDFLCNSTPGAGKTAFALYVASRSLLLGETSRVVVVVPTDHLRKQWLEKAAAFGIQLDDAFSNQMSRGEAADYDGVVVTYGQVASSPVLHRALCGARRTFVIFDEIHHAGGDLAWARQIRDAFEPAIRRLSITGTAFRSDNNPIPFVDYDDDGRSVVDFTYGYADAIRDGICREVYFPSFEGDLRWWTAEGGEVRATFRDALSEEAARRRLDTALSAEGMWLPSVLREAHQQLMSVRGSIFGDAAGLVVARDQNHARRVAKMLERITGEPPALAISDDPEASEVINDFAALPSPDAIFPAPPKSWIVAVKMVSEGVDIPRLFVGVYATNVMTELYFRQFVGRFVRVTEGVSGQVGYVYIPRDPTLVGFVQSMKQEREHAISDEEEKQERERQKRLLEADRDPSTFTLLGAEARADDVFFDGVAYSQAEIVEARALIREAGLDWKVLSDLEVARFMRLVRTRFAGAEPTDEPIVKPAKKPLRRVKDELREEVCKFVSRFVGVAARGNQGFMTHKFAFELLNHATGTRQPDATEEQLHRRVAVIKGWIELAKETETPLGEWEWWEEARRARGYAA